MLNNRSSPGSSSTSRIRPRSGTVPGGLLCIWTIFAFPDRLFDVRDGVEPGAHVVERRLELPVFFERRRQLLRRAVVALGSRCRSGSLQAAGFGIEDQPLLDILQMYQRENTLVGQQRIARGDQLAEQRLSTRIVARRMRRRRERKSQH